METISTGASNAASSIAAAAADPGELLRVRSSLTLRDAWTFAEASREPEGSVALRAMRGGAPFADMTFVKGDEVELTLFDGATDARLEARLEHVALTVWTERDAFLYEPGARFAVDGYLVPYAEATPLWHYAGAGAFHAEVSAPPGVRPAAGSGPLRANRSCDEMRVVATWDYDPSVVAAASVARILLDSYETVDLPAGSSLPISREPGGPPAAFLEPTATIALQVRDAPEHTAPPGADLAYVTWDTGSALVFGWAPRAILGPVTGGGGGSWRRRACRGRFLSQTGPRTFRQCEAEVPLFVRSTPDAAPTVVGTLGRDALFRVDDAKRAAGDELRAVHPELAGLSMSLRDDAAILVRKSDLAACPEVVLER